MATAPALTQPDWQALFTGRVLPQLGVRMGGVATPMAEFICGQPGAGKSTLIDQHLDNLGRDQTQVVSSDDFYAALPEIFHDTDDPALLATQDAFPAVRQLWFDTLVARATGMGAHLVFERPAAAYTFELANLVRAAGYRVGCSVLAIPPEDSWLAALMREVERPDQVPRRIAWSRQLFHCRSWVVFLAKVEASVAVDRLQVVGRGGEVFFANEALPDAGPRRWRDPALAVESLLVERHAPRDVATLDRMLQDWSRLRANPEVAFGNHEAWPHATITGLGARLQSLRDDPASRFDLNQPGASDPAVAAGWLSALRAELVATLALPDTPADLAPRCEALLALLGRIVNPAGSSGSLA